MSSVADPVKQQTIHNSKPHSEHDLNHTWHCLRWKELNQEWTESELATNLQYNYHKKKLVLMKSSLVCTSEAWAADIAERLPSQSEEEEEVVGFLHMKWYVMYFEHGMKRGL